MSKADIFEKLKMVGSEALEIVKRRSIEKMRSAAARIRLAIDNYVEACIEEETEKHISDLIGNGGWDLNHLPGDCEVTERKIRDLVAHWSPSWAIRQVFKIPRTFLT